MMANKESKPVVSEEVSQTENDQDDDLPSEMTEVLNGLPETQRREVTRMMSAGFSMISRTSPEGEIAKKITAEHITSMLETQNWDWNIPSKRTRTR